MNCHTSTFCKKMQSKTFSIATASIFVVGVIAWYGARYWAFGQFRIFSIIGIVLAIALAIHFSRGDVFSRWLTFALSSAGAYSCFNLFFHIRSKAALLDGKEITGEAFVLPGVLFSVCSVLLIASCVAGWIRKP
jgi:hypothetical protein